MSQTKVQLIQPIGIMTAPGVNVSGTLTATTFDGNLVGAAGSIAGTPNVNAGIFTATSFYGSGSGLSGVPSGPAYVGQSTAAQSGTTTIDLSTGNIVYFTQDTDTTVAFANTESVQEVRFIRVKDDTTTARTITWPASIIWNGGTAPTLIDSSDANDVHMFNLTTRDQGVTWYGYETMKNDPAEPAGLWFIGGLGILSAQNDTNVNRSSPVQIPGTGWNTLWGGYNEAAAIKSDNTLWVWGYSNNGQLGQNDRVPRSSPVQIPGTQWSFNKIGGGQDCTTAIKTDGTLWTWGGNIDGKLSQNDGVPRSSPVQIPGTQWSEVSDNGYNSNHFLKTDGTLWNVGTNFGGVLAHNDANSVNRSSPTQVPGTQWSSISSGYYHAIATKTDGTLWTWGFNGTGELSQNDKVHRSSPVQIPGTQWNTNRGYTGGFGSGGGFGIKTDGTMWIWGRSNNGQLGQNDVVYRSSPVQIPGTQWSRVTGGPIFSNLVSAQKTDGTLWVWGYNNNGQLGLNDIVARSSPVQIPGTSWSASDTGSSIFAIKS
jgi:hypothetical protein